MADEITLAETKPATEWIRGRPVPKVSPKRRHALVQKALLLSLDAWAAGRGEVGPEWRHRIAPGDEVRRPLVPDVAYTSFERLRTLTPSDRDEPPFAPDIAVEVRSPDDREHDIEEKIDVYLRGGSRLVLLADPSARTLTSVEAGRRALFRAPETFTHAAFPGLRIDVAALFAELDDV